MEVVLLKKNKNALLKPFRDFGVWGAWVTCLPPCPAINFSLLKKRKNLETLVLIDQVYKLLLFLRYRQKEHPVQFSSVTQSCPTLCNPMNRSTPGLPVYHQLPKFTQTHVHRVSDVIEPSHPLSSPSPPAPNPSQHQGFFQWVNSSHEVAKVLEFLLQHQSFQWTPRTDLL